MLLKDLKEGQRFMFSDRETPIALITARGQHRSLGTFRVKGSVADGLYPTLLHEETGREMTAVNATNYREVLPIL